MVVASPRPKHFGATVKGMGMRIAAPQGTVPCLCGCGALTSLVDAKGRPRKGYVRGHNGRADLAELLASKTDRTGPDGCWLWLGTLNQRGYGVMPDTAWGRLAHRVSYALAMGDVPDILDHVCHDPATCPGGDEDPHRRCVNPAHLVPSTRVANVASIRSHRRNGNSGRTHCKRGHEFTEENTRITKRGARACRACHREYMRRWQPCSG